VCLESGFAVGAQDVNGLYDLFMDVLDEFFDWFGEDLSFWGCEGPVVASESVYSLCPFCLLEIAGTRVSC
jgi:hypothetical protein